MIKLFTLVVSVVVLSSGFVLATENIHSAIFEAIKDKHPKEQFKVFHHLNRKGYKLNSEEGIRRYKIFKSNLKSIKEHNAKPNQSYTLGVTPYSDMTYEEFNGPLFQPAQNFVSIKTPSKPGPFTPIDWSKAFNTASPVSLAAIKTPLPNPNTVASAMAAASAYEAAYYIKNGVQIVFSPQAALDCCNNAVENMDYASYYGETVLAGVHSLNTYPWTGQRSTCKNIPSQFTVKKWDINLTIYNFETFSAEDAVQTLTKYGPYIFQQRFSINPNFTGGIYPIVDKTSCDNGYFQSSLVVGYGIEKGTEFWIIKSAGGYFFGQAGFIRIQRDDSIDNGGITCSHAAPKA